MAPRSSFTGPNSDVFLSKGPTCKLEFLRFEDPLVGTGFRGIAVGIVDFGVGA